MIASAPPKVQTEFLSGLSRDALRALPYVFEFWALPHQLPPEGDWRSWVVLGGRGAGKTRAGAEWVRSQVEGAGPDDPGRSRRVALVGATYDQARDVMVMGESGILAISPPDRRPRWQAERRRLVWPNGAVAQVFSARDHEALRGPQFDAAWADELGKWENGQEAWDMLAFAVRLGDARKVVTTTPRSVPVLTRLLRSAHVATTTAATRDNRANLAGAFLEEVETRFGGTTLGAQELDGRLIEDAPDALWTRATLQAAEADEVPPLDRVVVAVDPAASSKRGSDACGIVVAGAATKGPRAAWRAYVLEDASVAGASPDEWGRVVADVARRYNADRVVVESNQGGEMIAAILRGHEPGLALKSRYASRGKSARAEPVAALYEQGRVRHVRGLTLLETEMRQMTRARGFQGQGSPDRTDALVWALHELLIAPGDRESAARVRGL